jgi:hypothetical protein
MAKTQGKAEIEELRNHLCNNLFVLVLPFGMDIIDLDDTGLGRARGRRRPTGNLRALPLRPLVQARRTYMPSTITLAVVVVVLLGIVMASYLILVSL